MNGVVPDEAGRSINMSGSRTTGVTPCLKRLGVAVKLAEEQQPKRKRYNLKSPPECTARSSCDELAPAADPRPRSRNPRREAKGKTSSAAKGKATLNTVLRAAKFGLKGSVRLGGQQCKKGKRLHILEQILKAAAAHKVTASDPLERATEYANFLSALPSSLALGDYTSKHLIRKHLLQFIAVEARGKTGPNEGEQMKAMPVAGGLGNISMARLLEIFPDVGSHLTEVESALTPVKLAKVLGCATVYLTMWPCLLHEALHHRPQSAKLLWGTSVAEIRSALCSYRHRWGFNPSPRVLLAELENCANKSNPKDAENA